MNTHEECLGRIDGIDVSRVVQPDVEPPVSRPATVYPVSMDERVVNIEVYPDTDGTITIDLYGYGFPSPSVSIPPEQIPHLIQHLQAAAEVGASATEDEYFTDLQVRFGDLIESKREEST